METVDQAVTHVCVKCLIRMRNAKPGQPCTRSHMADPWEPEELHGRHLWDRREVIILSTQKRRASRAVDRRFWDKLEGRQPTVPWWVINCGYRYGD